MQDRQLVHDVPIEVIVRKMWGDYEEPTLQDFHVSMDDSLRNGFYVVFFFLGYDRNARFEIR